MSGEPLAHRQATSNLVRLRRRVRAAEPRDFFGRRKGEKPSDTAGGYIRKHGGIEIHYDIGELGGNFAKRVWSGDVEWTKTEKVGDDSVLIVLTKQKKIFATYEKDVANFTAQINSQSDIDDFLKMVLTYRPFKRN